jgi:hypothetical protein
LEFGTRLVAAVQIGITSVIAKWIKPTSVGDTAAVEGTKPQREASPER